MNRIVNVPDMVVEDMLKGFIKVHAGLVSPTENPRVLKACGAPVAGKVGIVTGGGSGHKPAFIGYLGKNTVSYTHLDVYKRQGFFCLQEYKRFYASWHRGAN